MKKSNIILILLVISIVFTSIGYAYVKMTLGINGNVSFSKEMNPERELTILGQKVTAYKDNMASPNVTRSNGINFAEAPSDTNGKGLYMRTETMNDPYPIYYYRGNVDNNHVLFGGFCWKIVRTTENGGTKLIYDGVPISNRCNNTGSSSQIGTSKFNTNHTSLADVGYMYGTRYTYTSWTDTAYIYASDVTYDNGVYTLTSTSPSNTMKNIRTKHYTCKSTTNGSCSTVYYVYSLNNDKAYAISLTNGKKLEDIVNESLENTNESTIKATIDNWFKTKLLSQESKLEDAVWCNDRSFAFGGYVKNSDILSDSTGRTFFGALGSRVLYDANLKPAIKDELACPNKDDRFTVSDIEKGNGKLKYPVGLITADEATIAGHGYSGYSNSSYLYTGQFYWTLSPWATATGGYYSAGFVVYNNGSINAGDSNASNGVRPAIVLKNDIVATSGDGTSTNPYIVK